MVVEGCAIATVDPSGAEYASGHIVIGGNLITGCGPGPAPERAYKRRIDGRGMLATPGLVNCHHHLYQSATRGLARDANLFEWLQALYPVWAHIDADIVSAAARAGLAALALSGCSTTTDHHYVFPRGASDLLATEIDAAASIGLRFHPCRGSMDLGRSSGGLPPDEVTEDIDRIMAATQSAIDDWHDPTKGSMVRVAVAPCSPFSVSVDLMREAAALARACGVRLHTHLAETTEEEQYCVERYGARPVAFLEELGWVGEDVWFAHCVHLDESEIATLGTASAGVAHCPSSNARLGAGIAPVAGLLAAGAAVGLGVDGAASNEAGELALEMRQALLWARLRGGPRALDVGTALAMATHHGARCLGREHELGMLQPGKLADVALWRIDDLGRSGIADPVAALVLGPPSRVGTLIVNGRVVVHDGRLQTADEDDVAQGLAKASLRLAEEAGS